MIPSHARPYVHLVGSVPLADTQQVFRAVCARLGPRLRRLPDGETGERANWIRCIQAMLAAHPAMEIDPGTPPLQWRQWDGVLLREIPLVKFRDGFDPGRVSFELPYAEAAIDSFGIFARLRDEGLIPPAVKFQICLPTPLAPGYNYVSPRALPAFLPAYEASLLREIDRIAQALPRERLAIQWDVCQEVLMAEGFYSQRPPGYMEQILSQLARIGTAVPGEIELGYHLCYGSPRDEHIVQPKDTGIVVEMLNGIFERATRPVDFVHLPAPRERTDEAYFAPLRELALPAVTELILGLIHEGDAAGNRARLERARAVAPVAGIATECGWGRKNPERLAALFESHILENG